MALKTSTVSTLLCLANSSLVIEAMAGNSRKTRQTWTDGATEARKRKRLQKEMRPSIQGSPSLTILQGHTSMKIMDVKKKHTQKKKKRQIKKMILSGRLPYNHKPVHLQHLIDSMSESNQQMFPKVQVLYGNPSLLISNNLILDMFTPR